MVFAPADLHFGVFYLSRVFHPLFSKGNVTLSKIQDLSVVGPRVLFVCVRGSKVSQTNVFNVYLLFIRFRNVAKTEILEVSINKNLENGVALVRKPSEVFRKGLFELL